METRETLAAKYGPDPNLRPEPWREAGAQDVLRQALLVDPDETALARAVLTRLAQPKHGLLPRILPPRVAWVSFAGLWLVMAILGFQVTGSLLGDPILALALGEMPGWEVLQ